MDITNDDGKRTICDHCRDTGTISFRLAQGKAHKLAIEIGAIIHVEHGHNIKLHPLSVAENRGKLVVIGKEVVIRNHAFALLVQSYNALMALSGQE